MMKETKFRLEMDRLNKVWENGFTHFGLHFHSIKRKKQCFKYLYSVIKRRNYYKTMWKNEVQKGWY